MSLYDALRDLELDVDSCSVETLEREVAPAFTRVTTRVTLRGDGCAGRGEDVTYEERHHRLLAERGAPDLAGTYTLDEFSRHVGSLDLFPEGPSRPYFESYRRWGFESAALDLALKQAGTDLAGALGREYRPLRFVVSPRLGDPPTADAVRGWKEHVPDVEFKLDAEPAWLDGGLLEELAAEDRVRTVDLKSLYEEAPVQSPADPELYRAVRDAFPDSYLEDPKVTPETRPVLEPARRRVTWDKPVTSVESLSRLPFEPTVVNVKPSRFGSVENLLDTVEHCRENGIGMYGGGQFELAEGRGHVQALASLFYPDAPNDVSPREYHVPEPRPGAPPSPLRPPADPEGLEWSHL